GVSASATPLTQCWIDALKTEAPDGGKHVPIVCVDPIDILGPGRLRLAQQGFGGTGEPPRSGVQAVSELVLQGPQDSPLDGPLAQLAVKGSRHLRDRDAGADHGAGRAGELPHWVRGRAR